jgi:hypothetical protein
MEQHTLLSSNKSLQSAALKDKLNKLSEEEIERMSNGVQSCFNKVGHLRVCKQSKRGWEPQIFY